MQVNDQSRSDIIITVIIERPEEEMTIFLGEDPVTKRRDPRALKGPLRADCFVSFEKLSFSLFGAPLICSRFSSRTNLFSFPQAKEDWIDVIHWLPRGRLLFRAFLLARFLPPFTAVRFLQLKCKLQIVRQTLCFFV